MGSGLPVGHEKYKPFSVDVSRAAATFGDVDFINHGGQLLVPDADGDFYLEVIEPPTDDEARHGDWLPDAKWTVYRVTPERFQVVERDRQVYLVCAEWKPDWPGALSTRDEWFHEHLDNIAESMDMELAELRRWFCSVAGAERAMAYIAVAEHWGWCNFDHYPLKLTMHEVHERYEQVHDCTCERCTLLNRKTELAEKDDLDEDELAELAELNERIPAMLEAEE
ncbi:MAG: hypothetical protein GWN58_33240 [Anaerolineae bacterium]|nr:hypothetical protein [Thermoplasmata archaeon]NIV34141.1 hypothetical protein [Anaerolineae bacterium]NIY05992.1 hypothetical protein [Thermoplasmata archaeon]